MKIGFDARLIGFSGAGVYTYNLLRSLLRIDSENDYLIFSDRSTDYPGYRSSRGCVEDEGFTFQTAVSKVQ